MDAGENKFFFKVTRGLGVDARGVTSTGGVDDRSINRAIATGPAYPREGW